MIHIKKQSKSLKLQKDTEFLDPIYLVILWVSQLRLSCRWCDGGGGERYILQYSLSCSPLPM